MPRSAYMRRLFLYDIEPSEFRKDTPDLQAVVVHAASIVGLLECLVWVAASHVTIMNISICSIQWSELLGRGFTYVLLVVGKSDTSLNALIFFFHSWLASSVGFMYLMPSRSHFLITSTIHLPCNSTVVGPLDRSVGP